MAVSGRKIGDFQDSFSRGSAEGFEHCCDFCLTEGQQVEANGYCMDCREHLCNSCFKFHKKTSATKNHQLLDKDNMDKHSALPKPAGVCTEKCSIHRDEVIKYFCPEHEEIGCNDCIIMNHRACKLDYIPDKCVGIGNSDEYREIVKELDQKLKAADAILKKAAVKDQEIDDSHDRAIKDILKKRKEINDHLDIDQRKIEADASKKKATSKQDVNTVNISCTKFISNIKKLHSTLQNSKTTDQYGQLFIDIKRAKSELQSAEIQQAEILLGKTTTQFTFNSNKDLDDMLLVNSFGFLTERSVSVEEPSEDLQTVAAIPRRRGTFSNLQHKSDIKLQEACDITGCVALSLDKLVLAVYSDTNPRLMVVNAELHLVIEEKKLDSKPWEIVVLPEDQIAVTMPHKEQILIMTTSGKLSVHRSIKVKGLCKGIIYHQNCLYLLCQDTYSIHVLDVKGTIKNTISLTEEGMFLNPHYIVMSQDHSLLYVSNYSNYSIVSVTLQGVVSAVYKHKDLDGPMGMLLLEDGSLLVCCWNNRTIHHVSADLKQGREVLDGLINPQSVCFSAGRSEVFIGSYDDMLPVCRVKYVM